MKTTHPSRVSESIRHFVLLIDGTWVSASNKSPIDRLSNVYKLSLYVETHSQTNESQVCLYLPGLGSKTSGLPITNGIFAPQLPNDVERAYISLCMNYAPGDKIYIFGFSRGAVVARLVAGIIGEYGLLKPSQIEIFPLIWSNFLQIQSGSNISDKEKFRNDYCITFSEQYSIEYLGLFDTVYGNYFGTDAEMLKRIFLGNRTLGAHVKSAVHLLAAHETRSFFRPILFCKKGEEDQLLEQIWMPGVHTDIGGGYQENFLSKIALLTMLGRITEQTKLKIDEQRMEDLKKSIEMDLGENRFIVNNDCNMWIWRLIALLKGEGRSIDSCDACQFKHPVFDLFSGRVYLNKAEKKRKTFGAPKFLETLENIEVAIFKGLKDRMI